MSDKIVDALDSVTGLVVQVPEGYIDEPIFQGRYTARRNGKQFLTLEPAVLDESEPDPPETKSVRVTKQKSKEGA